MELIDIIPEFNLYEEFWKIYTKGDIIPPQYISEDAVTDRCLIGEGAEIYGEVHHSIIGPNVVIGRNCVIRDSIIMRNSVVGDGTVMDKAIVAEDVTIGQGVVLGCGEEAPNELKPAVYAFGIATGRRTQLYSRSCEDRQEHCHFRHNRTGGLSRRSAGKRKSNKGEGR